MRPGRTVGPAAERSRFAELPLDAASVTVFAPSPAVTITIEPGSTAEPDIHLHAGGQGFWVARMAARLGAHVSLCVPLGGESGTVLKSLLAEDGISVLAIRTEAANGAYVHDRRSGAREVLASSSSPPLARHELDDLYGVTLAAGLDSDVTLVTGPRNEGVLPADVFERLCRDLRANGRPVLADLSGAALDEALRGGIDLLKVSDEELVIDSRLKHRDHLPTIEAARRLQSEGASNVLVTRSAEPALMLAGERVLEVDSPHFTAVDEHGAGDSLFAGIGVGVAAGLPIQIAVKLGVAAGTLNVARRGLGTGHLREVSSLAEQVQINALQLGQSD
jgi:1-phosphofructokinase